MAENWLRRFVTANLRLWERDPRGAAVAGIAVSIGSDAGTVERELEQMATEGSAVRLPSGRWALTHG